MGRKLGLVAHMFNPSNQEDLHEVHASLAYKASSKLHSESKKMISVLTSSPLGLDYSGAPLCVSN